MARATKNHPAAQNAAAPKPAAKKLAATTPQMAKKLRDAASSGRLDEVVALLGRGCDPNVLHKSGSALAWAAYNGHHKVVTELLARRADPNLGATYPAGGGAMHAAAKRGSVELLEVLVAAGGDVNVRGQNDDARPLFITVEHGHVEAARWLLDHGADLHRAPEELMLRAVSSGSVPMVEFLHARGLGLRLGEGWRPLVHQAVWYKAPAVLAWLLLHGCDPNQIGALRETALHIAAGHEEAGAALIDQLVDAGADINARTLPALVEGEKADGTQSVADAESVTPLQIAVARAYPGNVERLLQRGADRHAPTNIPERPTLLDMARHNSDAHPAEFWSDRYQRIVTLLEG